MTHSPEFTLEMQSRLKEEQLQLQKELGTIAHSEHGNFTADSPEYERNDEVNATESADLASREATTEALEARLKEVEAALARIDKETYGTTSDGEEIPENRLRANPAATTLIN